VKVKRAVKAEQIPQLACAAETIRASLQKEYGASCALCADQLPWLTYLSTGVFVIDYALLGGIPENMITQLVGWESSGKTTLMKKLLTASLNKYPQSSGIIIDLEGTFDRSWAIRLGVPLSRTILVQDVSGENAVDILTTSISDQDVSFVAVDSIPALLPLQEAEASCEDAHVALQSRLSAEMFRKALNFLSKERNTSGHKVTTVLNNQYRSVIGGNSRYQTYSTPGGQWTRFGPAVTLTLTSKEHGGSNNTIDYNECSFSIKKSKIGEKVKSGEFKLIRSLVDYLPIGGIDERNTFWLALRDAGVISGGGSRWTLGGPPSKKGREINYESVFSGKEPCIEYLYTTPRLLNYFGAWIIVQSRLNYGLPGWPPDNYLFGIFKPEWDEINKDYNLDVS
jgi:RecA/RadA recombinase